MSYPHSFYVCRISDAFEWNCKLHYISNKLIQMIKYISNKALSFKTYYEMSKQWRL